MYAQQIHSVRRQKVVEHNPHVRCFVYESSNEEWRLRKCFERIPCAH